MEIISIRTSRKALEEMIEKSKQKFGPDSNGIILIRCTDNVVSHDHYPNDEDSNKLNHPKITSLQNPKN